MSPNEFDRSLMEDLSQLPPAPGEVESYTPWRAAMTKILWGMGLTTFRFEFFYLQYILPLLGAALLYLGYRTLRRENRWFRLCWVLSGVLLAVHMATDILTATPVMGWIIQNSTLQWGLTWLLQGMNLLMLFSLWRGTRTAFAVVGEKQPKDWLAKGFVCYLLALALALWAELVPASETGLIGITITNDWLYYGRPILFIALEIRLLWCIAQQSLALADRGYDITPVPVRFTPTVFLAGVFAVVLLSSIAALWLSSRAPALEAQPLSAVHAEEYSSVRAHLVDLGMDIALANSLDEAELERCSNLNFPIGRPGRLRYAPLPRLRRTHLQPGGRDRPGRCGVCDPPLLGGPAARRPGPLLPHFPVAAKSGAQHPGGAHRRSHLLLPQL